MLRVAVVYHLWPHYRQAVAKALDRSECVEYSFFGSGEPYKGIKHADASGFRSFVRAPFRFIGPFMWQSGAVRAALPKQFDAIIYLGDPHFVSTWVGAMIGRARGVPVLFWAHGWLRENDGFAKKLFRQCFFRLANRMLVYSERAKSIGTAMGYPASKITVVYNSLDVEYADHVVARIESGELNSVKPQEFFSDPSRPLVICTARIIQQCRFDVLLDAAALLRDEGKPINVLLVGDGPERASLEADSRARGLAVHFYGACYDDEITGQLLYHADMTVSPGKIGLTAMHSLMFGTPAVTHGNLEQQMPEVEALTDGKTGVLFEQNSALSLARAIEDWVDERRDRSMVRADCRAEIHGRWSPDIQAALIENAVMELTRDR